MKLSIGEKASFSKMITESDVVTFAGVSGDFNPIHVNEVKASNSIFGKRVAHGMLVGSLISSALGTKLPGEGTVYLEQMLQFRKPVYINDTCTAEVEIIEIIDEEKGKYRLKTTVVNQAGDTVIAGYAVVMYKGTSI